MTLKNKDDYSEINQGDKLVLKGVMSGLDSGEFTERQKEILLAGGLLKYVARR